MTTWRDSDHEVTMQFYDRIHKAVSPGNPPQEIAVALMMVLVESVYGVDTLHALVDAVWKTRPATLIEEQKEIIQ